MHFLRICGCALFFFIFAAPLPAVTAAFDLPGPQIEVRVTRDGKTLPISQVPNLKQGDRIWVHPNLSPQQSVNFLLVAAFLRGATNPPPESWFIKAETWDRRVREEGIVITVPSEAQQVLLFLAPATGGGFSTLRSTVMGKPGAFVRASQDLHQASLDRSRLNAYLGLIHQISNTAPASLHDRSILLARSLNIRLDPLCFDKPIEQQAPCLTQNTDQLVLEDGHSQSMVNALTSGATSDLIGQISTSRVAGGGIYSPYVGAIVDVVRMLDNFHTAGYQYIPALGVPSKDELNLKLNNPPSFRKPKSVLVISLPPVEPAQTPPLRSSLGNETTCIQKPGLVLAAEGAPLVFSSELAHDFVLQVKGKSDQILEFSAKADPGRGGFVIDTSKIPGSTFDADLSGRLEGYWGFDKFSGPTFRLRSSQPVSWTVPATERAALIVGRDDAIHVQSESAACVEDVHFKNWQNKEFDTSWKPSKANELEVQVPLKNEAAGPATLLVKQFGLLEPDKVSLQTYSEEGRLDEFRLNAGDSTGTLKGTRLDEVQSLEAKGINFVLAGLSRVEGRDELRLQGPEPAATTFVAGDTVNVTVVNKDGRTRVLKTTIDLSRPRVVLVSKSIEPGPAAAVLHLGSENQLPHDGGLTFFLKSEVPVTFQRSEKIEVSTEDGLLSTLLSLHDGSLILEDAQSVLAILDPLKSFGTSAFGKLHFRPVLSDGRKGDWAPLVTLVRVPSLTDVRCVNTPEKQCMLIGANLFLIDSIATKADFSDSVLVPLGLTTTSVPVPQPTEPVLYLKLRDDPDVVSTATLPAIARLANSLPNRRKKPPQ